MTSTRWKDWETHLVRRAQDGESVAFELLADEHRSSLRHLALRMLRDSEDADDAVQETFLKALRAIGSFTAGRPVLPWLLRICSNCCVDLIRQRRGGEESVDKYEYAVEDPSLSVQRQAEIRFEEEALGRAIQRLPEHYRHIILMRHFRHMDVLEIADELDKPEGTIKSWLFRARAQLKKELMVAG